MSLTILRLEQAEEQTELDVRIRRIIDILLLAVNDWPVQIETIEEFELRIRQFIGDEVLHQNVEAHMPKINLATDAWKAESLSLLLDVFPFYAKGVSLRKIIEELETYLSATERQPTT